MREQRARKREELLEDTERILDGVRKAVRRPGVRGAWEGKQTAEADITVTDDDVMVSQRGEDRAEARLDGIYIIRTSVASQLGAEGCFGEKQGLPGGEGVSLYEE